MNQRLKLAAAAFAGIVATVAAGGIAVASMGDGLGRMGRADANKDGQITRAEWVQAANARFDGLDANKDGKLTTEEMPRRHGRGGHHDQHGSGHDWDRGAPPPPQSGDPAPEASAVPSPQK